MAEQVRVDITAEDKASGKLDAVADLAAKVDKADPTVTVDADTGQATRAVADVAADVAKLTDADRVVVLKLQASELRAQLADVNAAIDKATAATISPDVDPAAARKVKDLRDDIDRMGGSDGPRLAGNQIADLAGPFGAASSAASDFGGIFDGLADISEKVAGAVGLNAAKMASAISGIGFGVAAAVALWSVLKERQRAAAEEQKKVIDGQRKLNEAVREGRIDQAAQAWIDSYGTLYDRVKRAGITWEEFITSVTESRPDSVVDKLNATRDATGEMSDRAADASAAIAEAAEQYDRANKTLGGTESQLNDVKVALGGVEGKTDDATGATSRLQDQLRLVKDRLDRLQSDISADRSLLDLETAFDNVRDAANEQMTAQIEANTATAQGADDAVAKQDAAADAARNSRDAVLELRDTTLTYLRDLGGIPATKITEIDLLLRQGDVDAAERKIAEVTRDRDVRIKFIASSPSGWYLLGSGVNGTATGVIPGMAAAPVVNVTQVLPQGYHGDALTDARTAARRSGGMYRGARR